MKRNYYFLAASLSDLSWGGGLPQDALDELIKYLEPELHPDDATALRQLFLFNDMKNAVWCQEPDDPFVSPSCYDRETLTEARHGYADVLPFLNDFFEVVRSGARRYPELPPIDELTLLFYQQIGRIESDFVRDYFIWELNLRNLTVAVSRENQGFPYRECLIPHGDAYDAIMSATPPDFGLSTDFPFIEELIRVFKTTHLTAQEEFMERLRWQWLDDRVGSEFFSPAFILAYVVKYKSVQRWQMLDAAKGDELFGEFIEAVRRSVRFSLEFSGVGGK